jgi:glycosyltransferase involved in cell wall biosynthesis
VLVPTKNEAANIVSCLDSLHQFGEVFVVDSLSSDGTAELARARGATVITFDWNGKYPRKKQWALENLSFSYRWVLLIDADEEVTPALAREIATTVSHPRHSSYFVGLDYVFLGRILRRGQRVYKLILFDRAVSRFPEYSDLAVDVGDRSMFTLSVRDDRACSGLGCFTTITTHSSIFLTDITVIPTGKHIFALSENCRGAASVNHACEVL